MDIRKSIWHRHHLYILSTFPFFLLHNNSDKQGSIHQYLKYHKCVFLICKCKISAIFLFVAEILRIFAA